MMKMAYIANSIIPGMSANSVHVMKMCEALKKKGVDITLVVPNYKDLKIQQNEFLYYGTKTPFNILRLGFQKAPHGLWNLLFSALAIIKVKYEGFDIVYTRSPIAARLLAVGHKEFIFEYHGIEFSKRYSEKKIFDAKNLKKMVVISKALKDYYMATYNMKEDKIIVLPDGVNLDEYCQQTQVILSEKRMKIAYVGGLYPGRGIDIVIEMAKRDPENDYLIVGGRNEQIKFWNDKLKGNILNLTFKGQIPNAQVPKLLMSQDILLMPYQKNVSVNGKEDTAKWMSPMKMFEYMASGRVIISSDLPVLREILSDKNAYLVKPADVEEWLETVRNIGEYRKEARMIAKQAKEDVKKFSWIERAEKIKNVL